MKSKRRIEMLRDLIRELEYKITEEADKHLTGENRIPSRDVFSGEVRDDLYDSAQWFHVGTQWDCPDSPFGWCMYHNIHDRIHDHCVFCHMPEERK